MHGEERYSTTSANLTISALRRLRVKVWKKANGFTKMKLNVFRFRFVDVKRLSRPTNAIHPSHPPRIANPSEKFQTRKWVAGEEFSCLFENNSLDAKCKLELRVGRNRYWNIEKTRIEINDKGLLHWQNRPHPRKRKSDLENWQRDQHLFLTTTCAIHRVQIVTPVGVHQNFP